MPCYPDLYFVFHSSVDIPVREERDEIPFPQLARSLSLSLMHTLYLAPAELHTSVYIWARTHIRSLSGIHRCLLLIP